MKPIQLSNLIQNHKILIFNKTFKIQSKQIPTFKNNQILSILANSNPIYFTLFHINNKKKIIILINNLLRVFIHKLLIQIQISLKNIFNISNKSIKRFFINKSNRHIITSYSYRCLSFIII